jgi:2-methylcitrate dehydratase PrpD
MPLQISPGSAAFAEFVVNSAPPLASRERAALAIADTIGVILAGAVEPAARLAQSVAAEDGGGGCRILGTGMTAGGAAAALANGVAAHALDYDDMCFVSLAHPSCALVPAILAAGEIAHAPAAVLADAYVAGFEIECRLGAVMNPRHYHERGWHCTSSIGTIGAAAAAARVLGLGLPEARHAIGIAASAACGFKENFGSMVKPLHAGLAAQNGLMAARLAARGFTASADALEGPQGYLAAMDSQHRSLDRAASDLGSRWEIVDTGITVKLYPSCAATHPPIDALLELRRDAALTPEQIGAIDVEVDSMTARLLIHTRPRTPLEAKFSMPFCAAAAVVYGAVGIDTFDAAPSHDPLVAGLMPRVTLRVNPEFDRAAPLSQANVAVTLKDGRVLRQRADGARGYPGRISEDELAAKFAACAARTLPPAAIEPARDGLRRMHGFSDVCELTALFATTR